ncbi:hypothetical protein [Gramella sp. MAR_2010_147]|uniref:hypothetical protein n=1 Tax=Gramella sp. MAR_2010_147 TaxID=1250205 RepID=UPI00087CE27C|nr:hypothetical protein [Gramella sp. MAR_2010_147]SDR86840.1 hypothetical protein SAMN04488553_0903 [Gramella sp. MAR_2010_147]
MKKFVLIVLVLFSTSHMMSQEEDRDAQRERIKALKVAFLTQELNLNNKLAEKFWPIYNEYESKKRELHKREHIELENVECIDEDSANDLLDEFLSVENEEYKIKKQLFKDLKQIISAKDIIKLHKLEDEFHKKLIKEYRSKRERKDNNSSE